MTPTKELIARLRAHQCTCGGPCGQRTPAYIAEAADRLEALAAPVEWMTLETTPERRAWWVAHGMYGNDPYLRSVHRDFDRLSSALAAERERSDRLAEALASIVDSDAAFNEPVAAATARAALQEKQT